MMFVEVRHLRSRIQGEGWVLTPQVSCPGALVPTNWTYPPAGKPAHPGHTQPPGTDI